MNKDEQNDLWYFAHKGGSKARAQFNLLLECIVIRAVATGI